MDPRLAHAKRVEVRLTGKHYGMPTLSMGEIAEKRPRGNWAGLVEELKRQLDQRAWAWAASSGFWNGSAARLAGYHKEEEVLVIEADTTNFLSGLACDLSISQEIAIDLEPFSLKHNSPERSPLSNTLGVSGFLLTSDQQLILTRRSLKSLWRPGKWTSSSGGALEVEVHRADPYFGVLEETESEIGVSDAEVVEFLGLYLKGHEPYLSFLLATPLNSSEVIAGAGKATESWEFEEIAAFSLNQLTSLFDEIEGALVKAGIKAILNSSYLANSR